MKTNEKRKGIWIPQELVDDHQLNWTNKALLYEIMSLSKLDKGCHASNEHFAQLLGIGKSSVSKRITQLQDLGYIITNNIYDGKRCIGRVIQVTDHKPDSDNDKTDDDSSKNHQKDVESNNGSSDGNQGMVPEPDGGSSDEDEVVVPERPEGSSTLNSNNTDNNTKRNKQDNNTDTGANSDGILTEEDDTLLHFQNKWSKEEHMEIIDTIFDNYPKWKQDFNDCSDINHFLNKHKNFLQNVAEEWQEDPDNPEDTKESWYEWFNANITSYYYRCSKPK